MKAMDRRRLMQGMAGAAGSLAIGRIGWAGSARAEDDPWLTSPDIAAAAAQVKDFQTYGMPDDWANYGDVIEAFRLHHGFTEMVHTDTTYNSKEQIDVILKERANPVAALGEVSILWAAAAAEAGILPAYTPPSAAILPESMKGVSGGWLAPYTGAPAIVVNTDLLSDLPATWEDLLKPEYTGRLGSPGDPRSSGTGQATFLAWAYAFGGGSDNLNPAVDFGKKLLPQFNPNGRSNDALEKGEIIAWVRHDYNAVSSAAKLRDKGIGAEVIIPGVSVFVPQAVLMNGFNRANKDAAQLFADFVLSDEAQKAFARFGARPLRYLLGDLELDDEAKKSWLPDEAYAQVVTIDDFSKISGPVIAQLWDDEVASD